MPAWLGPALQGAAGAAGAIYGGNQAKDQAAENWRRQRQMARTRIQWMAQDAKKAGIHPLAAIAGGLPNYQNVQVTDGGYAAAGSALGQGISGAISAQKSANDPHTKRMKELELAQAEADLAQTQTATAQMMRPGLGADYGTGSGVGGTTGKEWARLMEELGLINVADARSPEEDLWQKFLEGDLSPFVTQLLVKNVTKNPTLKQIHYDAPQWAAKQLLELVRKYGPKGKKRLKTEILDFKAAIDPKKRSEGDYSSHPFSFK